MQDNSVVEILDGKISGLKSQLQNVKDFLQKQKDLKKEISVLQRSLSILKGQPKFDSAKLESKCKELLADGSKSSAEIKSLLGEEGEGLQVGRLNKFLNDLVKKGIFQKVGRGLFGLV